MTTIRQKTETGEAGCWLQTPAAARWMFFDPCQLVWQGKQFGKLVKEWHYPLLSSTPARRAGRGRRGKNRVVSSLSSFPNSFTCQASWQGSDTDFLQLLQYPTARVRSRSRCRVDTRSDLLALNRARTASG